MPGVRWSKEDYEKAVAKRRGGAVEPLIPEAPGKGQTMGPNKTEQRFADEYLEPLRRDGDIASYHFEAIRLRLGWKCFYTPDWFAPVMGGRVMLVEVKGAHAHEDSIIKFKTAVSMYPCFRWVFAQWKGGRWEVERWS